MAIDKAVDSGVLDTALTYTAGRIRAKTGSADQIAWDAAKGFGDKCTRDTGKPVYHALSELVGIYVEVVTA